MSQRFTFQDQDLPKLAKSALIVLCGIGLLYLVSFAFPDFDTSPFMVPVLTGVCIWVANTVKVWIEK